MKKVFLFLLTILILNLSVHADTLILRDGSMFNGRLYEYVNDKIIITTSWGELSFPRAAIDKIIINDEKDVAFNQQSFLYNKWYFKNAENKENDSIYMNTIRNRTEYAYKEISWNGKSDITISVDIRPLTSPSYASYCYFVIFPETYISSRKLEEENNYRLLRLGYDDHDRTKWNSIVGDSRFGFNPTIGEWYTYKWDYDYKRKTIVFEAKDKNGSLKVAEEFDDFEFGFETSNRIIGFLSFANSPGYGNPKQEIEFRNLNIEF